VRGTEDRKGQLTHPARDEGSDSSWHRQLSELGNAGEENPYWLVPFTTTRPSVPFSSEVYDRVAEEVARYVDLGYRTFILDVPASVEEMHHTGNRVERAVARCLAA